MTNKSFDISTAKKATCLVVVDVQQGFRDIDFWGEASNPKALDNIESLVSYFSSRSFPIVVVRHDSRNPNSPLSPLSAGNRLEPFLEGVGDLVITKSVNSAFYGQPDLHEWLQKEGITRLVICGITTNFCCETTARMASNLGYEVHFILDATSTFDLEDLTGERIRGVAVMSMTAANLNAEFATVHESTAEFLS